MTFLQAVNIEEDFWNLNPEIKYMKPFKEFQNYPNSSKLMWAIYLYCDPNSRFSRMEDDDKAEEICSNYLETDVNIFELDDIKPIVEAYQDKILTKLQRSYNRLLKKLEERDNFIFATKYTEDNGKKIDDMLANSSKIYQQLKAIENELETEKKAANIKGGRSESLSERGII